MRQWELREHAEQKRMEDRLAHLKQDVPPPSAPDARDVADEDELEELSRMVKGSDGPRLEDEDELRAQVSHGKGKARRHKPARPTVQRPSAPHLHSERSAKPKGTSDRECWHFKQGMCRFGTRCRFKHVTTRASSTPGSPRSETSSVSRDSSERGDSSRRRQPPFVPVEEDVDLPLHFAYTPTSSQTSQLEKAFPEMKFWSASGTVPSVNPHLCLHVERFFQMANVVGILQSLPTTWQPGDPPDLVDHWGSPSRLWKAIRYACWNSAAARGKTRVEKNQMSVDMARRWQCVVPSLISNDDMRHHVALGLNLPIAVCRCDSMPCEHAPEPVAFLDVHGLYYRAPSEIAALLADTGAVMYSIAHWFNPEQGTGDFWSGEGRWRRDDKSPGIVTMDVDGATVRSYRHSDLGWLARLPQRFGGVALGVDLVSQMPSQRVYAFRASEDGWVNERDDSTNLSFVSSTSPTVWGSVDLFPQAKALATMRLSVGSIQLHSMGPFWDWSCEDKHVWVSKAMVEQAARYMAGQQRTPETRNNLIMWLERKMRINGAHPDVTAASIHVTALLGMLLHAEESMWAMHAFNDMGVFMAVWNQLLSGTPMRWWHWWMVAAVCLTIAFVPKFVLWGLAAHPAGGFMPGLSNSTAAPSNTTATGFEIMRATMPAPEDINMIIFLGFAVLLLVFRYACMWRQRFDASALVSSWSPFGSLRPPRSRILAPATFRDVTSVHLATREEFRAAHVGDEGPVGHFAIRAVVPAPKPFVSGSSMELSANPLERRVRYSAHLTYTATFPDVLPSVPSTGPASLAGAASRLAAVYYDKTVEKIVDANLLELSRWFADNNFHNWRTMIGSGCVTWGAGRTPEELITWFEGARSRECWDVDQSRFDSHQRQVMKRSTLECLKHLHDECVVGEPQIMAEHEHAHECAIKRLDGRTAHFSYRTATHTASGSGARREECFRVRLEGTAVTGASNTSLNATTTQAKVCYYVLVRHLPRGQNPADHFRILVCGDDTVIKWLRKPLCSQEEFEAGMQNLGFKAKVHVVPEGENAVYCSSLAWMGCAVTGSRAGTCVPVLGPLPFRQLAKFSTMANPPLGFTRKEAARAKALSLYKRANHVPLLGTFIRRVLEYTAGADQKQVDKLVERERLARWAEDSEDGPYDLTPEGVKQFLDRYEISPEGYRQLDALMATHEPDHYYRHPLINHGVAIDCDLTGDEGLFQNTDHLVSSPFRRHLDDDASLMEAKRMLSPLWEADSDEWHPPQMPAMGFDEWFEEYRRNVGGASDPDGKPRAGRAANVLAERRRYVEGDHRSLDYAVSNTDVFVKVEALNKSVEGLDEHFAPRAIECEKEAMIALNGPYDKTLYRVCHAVFPCPKEDAIAHHIRIGGQPDRARPADKCRMWLKRLRPLLLFAAIVLAAAAVAGARADPGTQIQGELRASASQHDFRPPPSFAGLPDSLFWPIHASHRTGTLSRFLRSQPMPKTGPVRGKLPPRAVARARSVARLVRKVEKKSERKAARPRAPRRSRGMSGSVGGMRATASMAPARVDFDYHPSFKRTEMKDGCLVEYTDLVFPVVGSVLSQVQTLPFSLDVRDQTLQNPGAVMAKLRQEASMWARYQVLDASLQYAPKLGTAANGAVAIGIVPGELPCPSSSRELATFWGAAYGSVGSPHKTAVWKPRENRLFNTDRAGPDLTAQRTPFSVCATVDNLTGVLTPVFGNGAINPSVDVGELFIRVRLRFQDACPPPSNQLTLYSQDFLTSYLAPVAGASLVQWKNLNSMSGDFNWNPNSSSIQTYPKDFVAVPNSVGGTVAKADTATALCANGFFFDLEPGSYDVNVILSGNAPVPLETIEAKVAAPAKAPASGDSASSGWLDLGGAPVRRRAVGPTSPDAAADIYVAFLSKDLNDPESLWTCRGFEGFNLVGAFTNDSWYMNVNIPKAARCCISVKTDAIPRVFSGTTKLIISRTV